MSTDFMNIDGNIKRVQKETLTPYKIATVILIKEYCNETTKAIVERRDFCLAALKLIQSPDMELSALLNILYSPEYILHRFAHRLEMQLNVLKEDGVEGLLDLFDSVGHLMKPTLDHSLSLPGLNKNSVLGLYIRRVIIFFEKLPFDQVVSLYEVLKKYLERKANTSESSDISTGSKAEDTYTHEAKTTWGGRQAELLVAQQAQALQTDEHKAMSPTELQILVRELLSCSPYYAEAHYLSYLNCLRVNEYCGAIDSLYHCFDRLAPLENRTAPEDRSRIFRYAALNLVVLHAQFNHKEVALAALKEAIMMAQEAGDNVCLQLAHAWMYHLTTEQKGLLIERSVGKASMLGITHTTGLGLIAYAHNSALEAKNPSQVFETLMKSDVLNCQHSMTDLMSMTYAEKSALWAYYGKTEMSSVCAQLLLLHNTGDKKQPMFNGPSTCQAVVNIWMLGEQLYIFTQLIRHEKWSEAETIAMNISSLDPLECKFRLAEVCLGKGDYPKGLECIDSIEEYEQITPQNKIRAMLLLSQIMHASVSPENGMAGVNSLVPLNTALEVAIQNHLSYYEALIKMHLSNTQVGRAFVLYAKCLVATAPICGSARKEIILKAIKALSKAKGCFTKVEAYGRLRDTLCLESLFCHEIDLKIERNQYAFEFRQLDEQFLTKLNNLSLY
ncbi:Anaphase-promoting complex subunit 5 [Dufourea novaeangliae]|uniref:Anaphase-promoting complex subunit 5 n=1 Tax=Dufourea novaeangliae TaxID=178035 RepID=A0A154PLE9_DUFNO|nr:Anaphase-promoting complex subunit 5 [Dufourea novaeangliae]